MVKDGIKILKHKIPRDAEIQSEPKFEVNQEVHLNPEIFVLIWNIPGSFSTTKISSLGKEIAAIKTNHQKGVKSSVYEIIVYTQVFEKGQMRYKTTAQKSFSVANFTQGLFMYSDKGKNEFVVVCGDSGSQLSHRMWRFRLIQEPGEKCFEMRVFDFKTEERINFKRFRKQVGINDFIEGFLDVRGRVVDIETD